MKFVTVYTLSDGSTFTFGSEDYPQSGHLVASQIASGQQIHAFGQRENDPDTYLELYIPFENIACATVEVVPPSEQSVTDAVCPVEETTQVDPGVVVDPGQGNQ